MDQVKGDIFMTEYFQIDSEKVSLLPQLTKTPKTASTLKNLKIMTSKNKSTTSSSINLSHRRLTSPNDQSIDNFESRFQKFRADVTERAKTGSNSVKHSELDSRITNDVSHIERQVSIKQQMFNKIRHEVAKKTEFLERMKSELASMRKEDTAIAYILMDKRKNELKEIQSALLNERHYKETLDYLFNQKKTDLPEQEKNVISLKESLKSKQRDLNDLKGESEKEKQEIMNLEKNMEQLKEDIRLSKELYESTYRKNVQVFSQKTKFRETIDHEHELNKKNHKQKIIEKKIKELRSDLAAFEKDEMNWANEQKKVNYKRFMDEEYFMVKLRGVSNHPEQLNEEFEELQIKKENLDKDKEQSIDKIQNLTAEWQRLNRELNDVVLNHESDRKINLREFERIELSLKEKNKQMNESEKILNNLETIISSICGSVSRIGIMLDEDKTYVKPRQLKKHFDYFIVGIENRLRFITQQMLTEEKLRELSFKFPNFVSIYCKNRNSEDSSIWQL